MLIGTAIAKTQYLPLIATSKVQTRNISDLDPGGAIVRSQQAEVLNVTTWRVVGTGDSDSADNLTLRQTHTNPSWCCSRWHATVVQPFGQMIVIKHLLTTFGRTNRSTGFNGHAWQGRHILRHVIRANQLDFGNLHQAVIAFVFGDIQPIVAKAHIIREWELQSG